MGLLMLRWDRIGSLLIMLACVVSTATLWRTVESRAAEARASFASPVGCRIGSECFVQQYVDLDPTSGTLDPFCEKSTYDGHDGTDIRVLSMVDVERGIPVLAVADGTVLRTRNDAPDKLVRSAEDHQAVSGRECGNGLVVEHAEGVEAQYCHLRQGSVQVRPGDRVNAGQTLGMIGASGLAEFPHVHLTVRIHGTAVDPITGRAAGAECDASAGLGDSLFEASVAGQLAVVGPQRLASGLADGPVTEELLVEQGPISPPGRNASAIVGWSWLVNLRKGDRLTVRLLSPDGSVFAENDVPALDRDKASYVAYAGRRRPPVAGDYVVETVVRRGEGEILRDRSRLAIE